MKKSILFLLTLFSVTMTTQAVDYYYRGEKNSWGDGIKLTLSTDGSYYYYEATAGTHAFKIIESATDWGAKQYRGENIKNGYNGTNVDLTDLGGNDHNCQSKSNSKHYILLYLGNNDKTAVVCASTTLPNGLNTVWVKHNWGGANNWSYKQATDNGDGTFSLSAKYGESGCNLNAYNGENAQWWYDLAEIEVEAGLNKGDDAVFTVDAVTRKISVTKKVNKNIGSVTVTMACAQQPNIYYFGGVDGATTYPDWPGVKMNDNGNGTYSYKVDNVDLDLGLDYVITLKEVNENEWKSGDLNAKADVNHDASILNITSIAMHGNFSGGWKDSEYYSVNDENYNSATLKMTIENGDYEFGMRIGGPDKWTSNGKTFTRTTSSAVVEAGSGNLKLTADMTGEYEFKWTYKTNTLEIVFPEEEVVVSHTYTVVGSSPELFTNAWSPAETANNMEKQTDGSYKKVYNNIELTSDVEWKIAKDGTWWDETPLENKAANGNSVLTISKSGIYNVTFTLSADLKTAHAEAELLEETNTVADCFVSGNAALTGGAGWAGNEFKMEYDPATETYSYTLTGLAAETAYELQVVLGGNWYGYEKLQTIPTGVENKEGHIAFTLAEAGDVTITYHATNGINLTGNFAEPAPEVSVTLYFVNADKWTNLKAHIWVDPSGVSYKPWEESESLTDTDNDHNGADIYSYTFSNKYNRIIWKGDDGKQTTDDVAAYDVATPYYYQGAWYATLDEIPAVVEKKYYVKGTHNEWTADATSEMTLDGEVYKKEVTLAKDVEFKINDGASGWWGANNLGGKAYKELEATDNLKMKEAKTFTIIFNPSENLITFDGLTEEAPVVVTYQLKGVGGWEQPGIEMEQNPGKASEYMLTCQAISATDAIKVVRLENGEIKDYYGNGTVKDGVEVTVEYDDRANIKLPAGTYNFYFDTAEPEKKLWIAEATDCQTVTEITLTEGDNSSALATEGIVTVTVDRDFEKGKLYTIALPFTINTAASVFGNGTVVYNFANLAYDKTNEEYILGFTKVSKIEAGKPYLIEPGQNVNGFVAENVTLSSATSVSKTVKVDNVEKTATMTAVLSKTTTGGSYWLAEDRYLYNGEVNMPALRALFVLPTTPSGMPARARVALKEDAATGVEDLFTTDAPVKVIQNGQLIIIRDGVKYNVQGQVIR